MNHLVLFVNLVFVFWFRAAFGFTCASQNRLDDFFTQDEQSGHDTQARSGNGIAPRLADFLHPLFAAQFFQIIGGVSGQIGGSVPAQNLLHLGRQSGDRKAPWDDSQFDDSLDSGTETGFVQINAGSATLSHLTVLSQGFQGVIGDEGCVQCVQVIEKAYQDSFEFRHNVREGMQAAFAFQGLGVVNNGLAAPNTGPFAVALDSQLPEVNFENGQVILGTLDDDFLSRRAFVLVPGPMRTMFGAKDGLQLLDVQTRAGAVDHALKTLFQLQSPLEKQVTAVLHLKDAVVVVETSLSLFLQGQAEMKAGAVEPTVADLTQSPYSVRRTQGVCNLRQDGRFAPNLQRPYNVLRTPGICLPVVGCLLYYTRKTVAFLSLYFAP